MKVLRRVEQQQQKSKGSGATTNNKSSAAAPAASAPPKKVSAGIKVVNRAASAQPATPKVTQEQLDSRKVAKLLQRLAKAAAGGNSSNDGDASAAAAAMQLCDGTNDIDAIVGAAGFASLQQSSSGLLSLLAAEADDMGNADAREAALLALKQLCQSAGRACQPYVVPLLPMMLERLADKSTDVRQAASGAGRAVVSVLSPPAVELVLPSECCCGWLLRTRGLRVAWLNVYACGGVGWWCVVPRLA